MMILQKPKFIDAESDPIGALSDAMKRQYEALDIPGFEPTGTQEELIAAVGCGTYQIVVCLYNNKAGKTRIGAECIKNMVWPDSNREWFPHRLFRSPWPFRMKDEGIEGDFIKKGRIIGTVKNTADNGPIRTELVKAFPKEGVKWWADKMGKPYFSQYYTDTGFDWDVMTYQQEPTEFEGPFLSWTWTDEPPPEKLVGAITSRFAGGGIWLVTATPIRCGPFLATLKDLQERGTSMIFLSANIWQSSSITDGKPNHKGRKRGLYDNETIARYVALMPRDEVSARAKGEANTKSGMIYEGFDQRVHVIGEELCPYKSWDIGGALSRASNCFCSMDPHPKGFPAIQWWMLTPDNEYLCYNEWPDKEMLGAYYDEVRTNVVCYYDPDDISRFIKILDGEKYGLRVLRRYMDPRSGRASEGQYGKRIESLMMQYAKPPNNLIFELPQAQRIDVQREVIRGLLKYDTQKAITLYNKPRLYVLPHCVNTIRALERHYWDEETQLESERYKDFVDTLRYLLAGLDGSGYIKEAKRKPDGRTRGFEDETLPIHECALA